MRIDDGTVDRARRACQNADWSLEHERHEQENRDDALSKSKRDCHEQLSFPRVAVCAAVRSREHLRYNIEAAFRPDERIADK